MDQHADFLRALRARTYSRALRLQYGDWLQDHGDPRGVFVYL